MAKILSWSTISSHSIILFQSPAFPSFCEVSINLDIFGWGMRTSKYHFEGYIQILAMDNVKYGWKCHKQTLQLEKYLLIEKL